MPLKAVSSHETSSPADATLKLRGSRAVHICELWEHTTSAKQHYEAQAFTQRGFGQRDRQVTKVWRVRAPFGATYHHLVAWLISCWRLDEVDARQFSISLGWLDQLAEVDGWGEERDELVEMDGWLIAKRFLQSYRSQKS